MTRSELLISIPKSAAVLCAPLFLGFAAFAG
jgi:hypothetical protein